MILKVAQLSIQRGNTRILDNICWGVRRGEHWVILGPNGSGKTSLLSALTGYLTPSEGEILLLGRRYGGFDWRELRKKIGLVSSAVRQLMGNDEPALETVMSGKNATIDFRGRYSARDRERAAGLLRRVECDHLADRCWQFLSQGERQRVLIGRALMPKPRVLILDEPCAGLDPAAREQFLHFLDRLGRSRTGPALLLVTHHVEEIMPAFSHVLLLRKGRIVAQGAKDTVLTSKLLSATFDAPMRLRRRAGRFELSVGLRPGLVL